MSASEPVLSLRGITKRYGSVQALRGVDLDVRAGEVVALVGDNGAGKSTLIKVIAGVGPPDEGTVRWQGEPVSVRRPADAQALGVATVYQDLALCDNLDVARQPLPRARAHLSRPARRGGDGAPLARPAADPGGPHRRARPGGGALRRPAAGGGDRTLAARRPKVVLLDEPTAALGVEQTAQVLDLIERLRERGLGVILISHNLADVLAVADRVSVLRLGLNAGEFRAAEVTHEELVAAITGAADGAAARRQARHAAMPPGAAAPPPRPREAVPS